MRRRAATRQRPGRARRPDGVPAPGDPAGTRLDPNPL